MRLISFSPVLTGAACFARPDSGQNWQQINNGVLALYESAPLITNGYIFVGADFVVGAGGFYRSTDYGDSWVEINHDMIQTDVRALATDPSGHIFAGTYFGGGVFRSTDNGDSWTSVNNGLDCGNIRSHTIIPVGTIFAGTAGCGTGVYRSTDNGDSWTLANIGLTSTYVAALAANGSNYNVFAGTHSIMGKGSGMFRSADNGDTWTEQDRGFTALDVKSVVINPIGHIFAGAAGGVFRSMNDADQWSDVSNGLLPPGGNVWAVATRGIASGGFAYAGTAGGGVFRSVRSTAAVRVIPRPRPRPTPAQWP